MGPARTPQVSLGKAPGDNSPAIDEDLVDPHGPVSILTTRLEAKVSETPSFTSPSDSGSSELVGRQLRRRRPWRARCYLDLGVRHPLPSNGGGPMVRPPGSCDRCGSVAHRWPAVGYRGVRACRIHRGGASRTEPLRHECRHRLYVAANLNVSCESPQSNRRRVVRTMAMDRRPAIPRRCGRRVAGCVPLYGAVGAPRVDVGCAVLPGSTMTCGLRFAPSN